MVRMRITSDYGYGRNFFIWCDEERAGSGTLDKIETNRLTGLTGLTAGWQFLFSVKILYPTMF